MKNGNQKLKFLKYSYYIDRKSERAIETIYGYISKIIKNTFRGMFRKINNIVNLPLKIYHFHMIKKYPYTIEICNDTTDIICNFLLDNAIEYPKEVIGYQKNRIYIVNVNTYNWTLDEFVMSIDDIPIKPEITNNYDFYVYMTEFNKKFMFCFNDKKQFSKFKLIYGG